MKILIAGTMGRIGQALSSQLQYSAHELKFLNLEQINAEALAFVDVVIAFNQNLEFTERVKAAGIKHLIIPTNDDRLGQNALEALADDTFQLSILHYGTLCCMSDSLRRSAVLYDFVAAAITYGEINLFLEDSRWHSLIHVNDLARAIIWAINDRPALNRPFLHIPTGSDNWTFQLKDLAEAVTKIVPGSVVKFISAVVYKDSSIKPDYTLFRTLAPNHQPRYVFEHTILQLYAAYLEAGLSDHNPVAPSNQDYLYQ